MTEPEYTIQELSDLSGVPRRTIHFYIQQDILPPPQSAGLAARYSDLHLARLRALPVLRRRGLRLDQIRQEMAGLDLVGLQQLLAQEPRPTQPDAAVVRPAAQPCQRYIIPGGIELIVPATLSPAERRKVDALLQAASEIFSTKGDQNVRQAII